MCCSSAKGEGCLRNGHPKGHPLLARGVLLVSFCLVIGLNVGIDNVRLEVRCVPPRPSSRAHSRPNTFDENFLTMYCLTPS